MKFNLVLSARRRKGDEYAPIEQTLPMAREFAKRNNILSAGAWSNSLVLPYELPSRPDFVYKEKFIDAGGWKMWLGHDERPAHRIKFLPYVEALPLARKIATENGIKSLSAWKAFKGIPSYLPKDPSRSYHEFESNGGWKAWLGTTLHTTEDSFLSALSKARQYAIDNNIKSSVQWYGADLPSGLPKNPASSYPKTFYAYGGWDVWLGKKEIPNIDRVLPEKTIKPKAVRNFKTYMSAEEAFSRARDIAQQHGVTDVAGWKNISQDSIPQGMPKNPQTVYEDFAQRGGWGKWLGILDYQPSWKGKPNYVEPAQYKDILKKTESLDRQGLHKEADMLFDEFLNRYAQGK